MRLLFLGLNLLCACAISRQGIVVGDAKIEHCVGAQDSPERVCTTTSGGHLGEPFVAVLRGTVASARAVVGLP